MPSNPNVELWEEVRQQAFDEAMDLAEALIESQLGPDGEAPGDSPIARADRIARFVDMAQRNVLDVLEVISPTVHDKLMAQYLKDVAASPLVNSVGGASVDSQTPPDFEALIADADPEDETEPVYGVDQSRLPQMPEPWLLLQGYWSETDSVRVIPARHIAFLRRKTPGISVLTRRKLSVQIPYERGLEFLRQAPRIAMKARHLVRDGGQGRAWLIDVMDDGTAISESEYPSPADMEGPPSWSTGDLTLSPQGFTYTHAKPRSSSELVRMLTMAEQQGSRAPYAPSEGETPFDWSGKGKAEPVPASERAP